ncbi:hypothetical protein JNUCC1_01693 [Lentibacillus sp. JNUCC-1]|uniref:GvpL/GvpF family gas vesicle protein n=1 Tax=Lentibacillus sp. JNUCC-1 TaxID=2654513 RepID=UPI0012E986A0|nr:GvpL/GvpF family gas vesicle protein [Lentibacillus sp. JNUCC-1]MUV37887.1 hypothetical protein [Lentibacillus sp. JNUCC-1]
MNKIYLYALIPTYELELTPLPEVKGFDGQHELYTLSMDEVTAIVSDLEGEEYTEEAIKEKVSNDMPWLQDKAYHHHQVLTQLNETYTIIPLKFCTIYNHADSLKASIEPQQDHIRASFELVKDHEEWTVKIYCDEEQLKERVSQNSPVIEEKKQEIATLSPGRQFFEKKKIDKLLETEVEKEQEQRCQLAHEKFSGSARDSAIKKNLGKDVTGLEQTMCWNSVYLVPEHQVSTFLETIQDEEQDMEKAGYQIQATGPWPAYHFSSFS